MQATTEQLFNSIKNVLIEDVIGDCEKKSTN
jgi:hypothetical protein